MSQAFTRGSLGFLPITLLGFLLGFCSRILVDLDLDLDSSGICIRIVLAFESYESYKVQNRLADRSSSFLGVNVGLD